jgi:hypothetical protein
MRTYIQSISTKSSINETAATMSAERNPSTASGMRRKSVAEEPVTSVLAAGEVPIFDRELTADEEVLAALGYKYDLCLFLLNETTD